MKQVYAVAAVKLALWFPCCTSSAQQPSDITLELKAHGAHDSSPIVQSLVGAEYGNPAVRVYIEQSSVSAAKLKYLREQTASPKPPKLDWDVDVQPIKDMVEAIQVAQEGYAAQRAGIASARVGNARIGIALDGASLLLPNRSGNSALGLPLGYKIATGALTLSASSALEKIADGQAKQYSQALEDAVAVALLETDQANVMRWAARGVTESNREEALKDLLGPQNAFMSSELLKNLGPDLKADIANAKTDVLANSIGRLAYKLNEGDAAFQDFATDLRVRLKKDETSIRLLSRDVAEFRKQLVANTAAIGALASYTKSEFETISPTIDALTSQMNAVQLAMWRQMGPSEQLKALNDGFFPNLAEKTRAELKAFLNRTAKILEIRELSLIGLRTAGNLAKIAVTLGLPIDSYNFNRNIETASAAINTAANIGTGNWVGAIDSLTGLFGSGGVDPTQASLADIKNQLNEILRIQQEILTQIDNLSAQITQSTQILLDKLADIEGKVNITNKILAQQVVAGHYACANFIRTAQEPPYNMRSGIFPSYDARRLHFANIPRIQDFLQCRDFLSGPIKSLAAQKQTNSDSSIGRPTITHPLLLAEVNEIVRPDSDINSLQNRFVRMRDFTKYILKAETIDPMQKPHCMSRLLAHAVAAPRYFRDLPQSGYACPAEDIPVLRLEEQVRNRAGQVVQVSDALSDALAPAAVRQIGEFMLFISPYMEFIRSTPGAITPYTLLTEAELVQGITNRGFNGSEMLEWPDFYIDVINLAIGQEAIYAGVLAAGATADLLIEKNFGALSPVIPATGGLAGTSNLDIEALRQSCRPILKAWDRFAYANAVCLMKKNPLFEKNVIIYMVTRALLRSKTNLSVYSYALAAKNKEDIEVALSSIPVEYSDQGGNGGWFIRFLDEYGKKYLIALPSSTEISSNLVAYRHSGYLLHDMRDRLMERIALLSGPAKKIAADPVKGYYLRQLALSDPSYGMVNFEISLPEQPKYTENIETRP